MSLVSWIVSFTMSALLIAAQFTVKTSLKPIPLEMAREHPMQCAWLIACQPLFWTGVFLSGIIFLLTLYQYKTVALNVFVPSITIAYTLLLGFGSFFILREPFSWRLALGYALMVAASILIGGAKH
ncbi:hypothetical protein LLG95_08505 [bacterium]|nr:hypothetical protein [bacterium]